MLSGNFLRVVLKVYTLPICQDFLAHEPIAKIRIVGSLLLVHSSLSLQMVLFLQAWAYFICKDFTKSIIL